MLIRPKCPRRVKRYRVETAASPAMSAVPPKAEVNSGHQRYRALEIIAGTLERRAIEFMGAEETS